MATTTRPHTNTETATPLSLTRHRIVIEVREYIERHFQKGISLQDVARALGYTPAHLTYVIRASTGKPVNAWIIERRVQEARTRLRTVDDSIAKIAEDVGFRDSAYFARQFARLTGSTPSRWRNAHRGSPAPDAVCQMCGALRTSSVA